MTITESLLPGLLLIAVAAGAAWSLTGVVLQVAKWGGYIAPTVERSSHRTPTPYGGGLAVMMTVIGLWCWLSSVTGHTDILVLAAAAAGLTCVCWLDDRRSLSIASRLAAQAAAVGCGLLLALPSEQDVLPFGLPWWLDRLLTGVALVWFVNLYNFMDGIDGLAGVETSSLGLGCAVVAWLVLPDPAPSCALAIFGASAGFLAWNWQPARIFLGDAGSVPLGYLLGFLLTMISSAGELAAAIILPAYFLGDATVTLLRRIWRGERFWRPHREHYYQRAAVAFGRHDTVVVRVAFVDLGLLLLAIVAATTRHDGLALGAAVLMVAHFLGRLDRAARLGAAG